MNAVLLGIDVEHVIGATSNAIWHSDPFDRMLLAQAKAEYLAFITADKTILDFNLGFVMDARQQWTRFYSGNPCGSSSC